MAFLFLLVNIVISLGENRFDSPSHKSLNDSKNGVDRHAIDSFLIHNLRDESIVYYETYSSEKSHPPFYGNFIRTEEIAIRSRLFANERIGVSSALMLNLTSLDVKLSNTEVLRFNFQQNTTFRVVITDAHGNPVIGAKVRFIDKCTGRVQEMVSRSDGTVEFIRNLECDYELVSMKDDFTISKDIIAKTKKPSGIGNKKISDANLFNTKLYRVGDVIRLQNIYYSAQGYKLNLKAKEELAELVETMKKYPNMAIEIVSHTDTRGSASSNQVLSELRAKEVADFLSKSIGKNRIRFTGKGESQPVNICGEGVQCTESEHARNRRTEFRILQMERI
jgi:outer membrane protein OmpA-like peptidoglycan-associated protein